MMRDRQQEMAVLRDLVVHHIEGEETHTVEAHGQGGVTTYQFRSFGPDRWIDRVLNHRMTALDLLSIIAFSIDDFTISRDRCIEQWASALLQAIEVGQLTPRDRDSLLPLSGKVEGWDWLINQDEAQAFVQHMGAPFVLGDVIEHLANESIPIRERDLMEFELNDASFLGSLRRCLIEAGKATSMEVVIGHLRCVPRSRWDGVLRRHLGNVSAQSQHLLPLVEIGSAQVAQLQFEPEAVELSASDAKTRLTGVDRDKQDLELGRKLISELATIIRTNGGSKYGAVKKLKEGLHK